MGGTRAAGLRGSKRRQEIQRRRKVGIKGRLRKSPKLGVVIRLEHCLIAAHFAMHHAAVDQKQEHGHPTRQRRFRPVRNARQVSFQVEAGEPSRLGNQRFTVLIVAVKLIMSKLPNPLSRQVPNG